MPHFFSGPDCPNETTHGNTIHIKLGYWRAHLGTVRVPDPVCWGPLLSHKGNFNPAPGSAMISFPSPASTEPISERRERRGKNGRRQNKTGSGWGPHLTVFLPCSSLPPYLPLNVCLALEFLAANKASSRRRLVGLAPSYSSCVDAAQPGILPSRSETGLNHPAAPAASHPGRHLSIGHGPSPTITPTGPSNA